MSVHAFLVGAGPGDPGLITRRGLDLIRSCDVLLYDRLVARALLDEAPERAERVFVGKTPGSPTMPQASIDALIVRHARAGRRVVRLKGGDPFVFGRGADEGQALAAAGIPFEVVPGVSAAAAVPAYAGIPVTHGGVASSFAVVTAHESGSRPGADERFDALARGADTLVMLMGVASLGDAIRRLRDAGRAEDEPVALVERGTTPDQRTVVATVGTVVDVARRERIVSPTTIVVGQVVKLRDALQWFESRPLFGTRVVVTRPFAQAGSLADPLAELGADVMIAPTIEVVPPDDWADLDAAIVRLDRGEYEWVLFSSVNAVDHFFDYLNTGHDVRVLAGTKIAAVGPATEQRLRRAGIKADMVPAIHTGVSAAAAIGSGSGNVLLPRSAEGLSDVVDELRRFGWSPDDVTAYETVRVAPPPELLEELRGGGFDLVTFTSPSAVDGFAAAVGMEVIDEGHVVASIGPSTSARIKDLGVAVQIEPSEHTVAGLVTALEAWGAERGTISR